MPPAASWWSKSTIPLGKGAKVVSKSKIQKNRARKNPSQIGPGDKFSKVLYKRLGVKFQINILR